MEGSLSDRAGLMKLPVSALAGAAAALGYAACDRERGTDALFAGLSVFVLAAGACTLNNWQDRFFDIRLERTRRRPLPAKRMPPAQALVQALLLLGAGLGGLYSCSPSAGGPLAGLLAVFLYNAAYTPLKKRTLFALVPGVLCGTLPPLIGWLAAGGAPGAPTVLYLMALFGVWQVPHLWVLLLANIGDERLREQPSLLDHLSLPQVRRLAVVWAAAFAFLTLYLKVFLLVRGGIPTLLLAANALALPLVFASAFREPWAAERYRRLSLYLNVSVLGVTLLAAADTLF